MRFFDKIKGGNMAGQERHEEKFILCPRKPYLNPSHCPCMVVAISFFTILWNGEGRSKIGPTRTGWEWVIHGHGGYLPLEGQSPSPPPCRALM